MLKNLDIYVESAGERCRSPSGINDVAVGVKWRVLEHDDFSLGIKPEITFPERRSESWPGPWRHQHASLTLIGSYRQKSGDWAFSSNLAAYYNRYRLVSDQQANRTMQWRLSAYALYELNPKWSLVLDGGILSNTERAPATPAAICHSSSNPGYILTGVTVYSPTPNLDLDMPG